MAELSNPILEFGGGCPDCGERRAVLPIPLPGVANDFDWKSRDYDSFRLFMMQELAYRFPERRRWTPADMEVVIVELLAAALDRASHALDAVQTERYLETARRPQSVRRLLKLIGYDAVQRIDPAILEGLPPAAGNVAETEAQKLERYWRLNPAAMNAAREAGPRLTGEVRRMVTLADHVSILEEHPLVARARARHVWSGAWYTILIAVLLEDFKRPPEDDKSLDVKLHVVDPPVNGIPSEVDAELWNVIVETGYPLRWSDVTMLGWANTTQTQLQGKIILERSKNLTNGFRPKSTVFIILSKFAGLKVFSVQCAMVIGVGERQPD